MRARGAGVILCPNTSPLIVRARIDRLDLLGDPRHVSVTWAVLDEVHNKRDEVSRRMIGQAPCCARSSGRGCISTMES
jgi:hypothetical protein